MNSRHWCFILQMSRTRYFGSIQCLRLASTNGLFTNSITLISIVYTIWNFKLGVIPLVPFIKFYIKIFVLASHQVNALQEVASWFAMKIRVSDRQGIIHAKKRVVIVKPITYTEEFPSAFFVVVVAFQNYVRVTDLYYKTFYGLLLLNNALKFLLHRWNYQKRYFLVFLDLQMHMWIILDFSSSVDLFTWCKLLHAIKQIP